MNYIYVQWFYGSHVLLRDTRTPDGIKNDHGTPRQLLLRWRSHNNKVPILMQDHSHLPLQVASAIYTTDSEAFPSRYTIKTPTLQSDTNTIM